MKSLESIPDRFKRIPNMIELSKTFLTALDKKKNIAELMPFELFIEDYQTETKWISQQIQLNKQKGLKPLKAHSFFYHLDGRVEKMEVEVLDYDESIAKFYVQYVMPKSCVISSPNRRGEAGNVIKKQSGRLNLQFLDFETEV
jgi:ribosomal protein S8